MNFFNLFQAKPKHCTSCGNISPGLHEIYSGIRDGQNIDQLCTTCLIARLGSQVQGKNILFIEPAITDYYTYTPLNEVNSQLAKSQIQLALATIGDKCAICSKPSSHLWMPQEDIDFEAMESQSANNYYSIPTNPPAWKGTVALCDEHIVEQLRDYIESKRNYFLTFRFPDSSSAGYYD